MHLALVTESPVDRSHGTGALLLRLLAGCPFQVCNLHPASEKGSDLQIRSVPVKRKYPLMGKITRRLRRLVHYLQGRGKLDLPQDLTGNQFEFGQEAITELNDAELILGIIYSLDGLVFLRDCMRRARTSVPVVIWVLDYFFDVTAIPSHLTDFFANTRPRLWAFNDAIRTSMKRIFPWAEDAEIEEKFHLGMELPKLALEAETPAFGSAVVIGNFWNVELASFLSQTWTHVRGRRAALGPLLWYGPSEALARLSKQSAHPLGADLQYQGFADPLGAILRKAGLAVLPFSLSTHPQSAYTRHSFPSRVADYCAFGLPVLALAEAGSLLAEFVEKNKIGIVVDASSPEAAAAEIAEYLTNPSVMHQNRRNSRALAERDFDIKIVRDRFYSDLTAAAATHGRGEEWPETTAKRS